MLSFLKEKNECTGCMACMNACPRQCIEIKKDQEGFLYPVATDQCIHCGLCERVCPQKNPIENDYYPHYAYALLSKDVNVWRKSASGGAFTEICKAFKDGESIFFGAGWDDDYVVRHFAINSLDDISIITKSKYIQSRIDYSYQSVLKYLEKGIRVVFCGTPCQIAGLRSYLGRDYDNLLLIDLVCHGVGNTDVFKTCLKKMEGQFGRHIISYVFRAKRRTYETDYLSKVVFESGNTKYLTNDPYLQLFLKQNCLRPSCGNNCRYRTEKRQGDITIGDFKGLYQVFPNLIGNKYNYSAIVINSKKGEQIIEYLKANTIVYPCPIEKIKEFNPLFCKQTWFSTDRDSFFADFADNPEKAIENWTHNATEKKKGVKFYLYEIFPVSIRKFLINIVDKGQ